MGAKMTKSSLFKCAIAATILAVPVAVLAGEVIKGVGATRSSAMDDANERAADESARRFGGKRQCYTPAKLESCVEDRGDWICTAFVANHEGSCRRG
jgi:hypothetical protein